MSLINELVLLREEPASYIARMGTRQEFVTFTLRFDSHYHLEFSIGYYQLFFEIIAYQAIIIFKPTQINLPQAKENLLMTLIKRVNKAELDIQNADLIQSMLQWTKDILFYFTHSISIDKLPPGYEIRFTISVLCLLLYLRTGLITYWGDLSPSLLSQLAFLYYPDEEYLMGEPRDDVNTEYYNVLADVTWMELIRKDISVRSARSFETDKFKLIYLNFMDVMTVSTIAIAGKVLPTWLYPSDSKYVQYRDEKAIESDKEMQGDLSIALFAAGAGAVAKAALTLSPVPLVASAPFFYSSLHFAKLLASPSSKALTKTRDAQTQAVLAYYSYPEEPPPISSISAISAVLGHTASKVIKQLPETSKTGTWQDTISAFSNTFSLLSVIGFGVMLYSFRQS